ncbi:NTP transferase domain-containing protein, partial [Pleurocapsa sp. CCALA 161]|uniref:nucleotidyltransferase family protein n=1 Tax=Pleurocapsa sp. CCALA 161 TaxID=2107688 RepID=UPI0018ECFEF6
MLLTLNRQDENETTHRNGHIAFSALEQKPALNAVLILVCDQPFVSTALINQLIVAYQSTNYQIVATTYSETVGVPALLSERYFFELLRLNSDSGARQIIQQHLPETYT